MNNKELKHYGVLGMKWGVRKAAATTQRKTAEYYEKRYKDAPIQREKMLALKGRNGKPLFTEADLDAMDAKFKKRADTYKSKASKNEYKARQLKREADIRKEMKKASWDRRLLKDKDLQRRVERIKLEKQLKDLTEKEIVPGKAFAKNVMSDASKKVLTGVAAGLGYYAVKLALEKQGQVTTKDIDITAAIKNMPKLK